MRFTGVNNNDIAGLSGTIRVLIDGIVIWTSPPYTNTATLSFDSGPVSYTNPNGLVKVTFQMSCVGTANGLFSARSAVVTFR